MYLFMYIYNYLAVIDKARFVQSCFFIFYKLNTLLTNLL